MSKLPVSALQTLSDRGWFSRQGQGRDEILKTGLAGVSYDSNIKAFRKGVWEFHTYITNNAHAIPNYAERHRYGERISTAFVESTVNAVAGQRFSKKQQTRWSKAGAHLMLQTGTRMLDGTLGTKFQSWYHGLFNSANTNQDMKKAAA